MTSLRFYFFDTGRPKGAKELKDHPANGMPFSGTCGMARDARGEFIPNTQVAVYGRSPRCVAAGIGETPKSAAGNVVIARKDFQNVLGEIRVKFWGPGMPAKWFTLRDDDPNAPKSTTAPATEEE